MLQEKEVRQTLTLNRLGQSRLFKGPIFGPSFTIWYRHFVLVLPYGRRRQKIQKKTKIKSHPRIDTTKIFLKKQLFFEMKISITVNLSVKKTQKNEEIIDETFPKNEQSRFLHSTRKKKVPTHT